MTLRKAQAWAECSKSRAKCRGRRSKAALGSPECPKRPRDMAVELVS